MLVRKTTLVNFMTMDEYKRFRKIKRCLGVCTRAGWSGLIALGRAGFCSGSGLDTDSWAHRKVCLRMAINGILIAQLSMFK